MTLRSHYWGYSWLYRKPSIYITYLLSRTKITANQISLLVIILGIIASWSVLFFNFYLGIALAYLNLLFDGVDGEIARLRNVYSLKGVYLDAINHLLIPGLFLVSLTLAVTDRALFTLVGVVGALCWALLKATGKLENKIFFGTYFGNEDKYPMNHSTTTIPTPTPRAAIGVRSLLGIRYQIREFLIALIIFLLAKLAGVLVGVVFIYSLFLILHFFEEAYRGYFNIESRVRSLGSRLNKHEPI